MNSFGSLPKFGIPSSDNAAAPNNLWQPSNIRREIVFFFFFCKANDDRALRIMYMWVEVVMACTVPKRHTKRKELVIIRHRVKVDWRFDSTSEISDARSG